MIKRKRKPTVTPKELPVIPDKRYFTISEVGQLCSVKPYVLRFWEQEFSQLKPLKRRGNRRFYQQQDILLVRQIKKLLYEDGFTIEGARLQLSNATVSVSALPNEMNDTLKKVITELEIVLQNLQSEVIFTH